MVRVVLINRLPLSSDTIPPAVFGADSILDGVGGARQTHDAASLLEWLFKLHVSDSRPTIIKHNLDGSY